MPCHPDRVRTASLPPGYQYGEPARHKQAANDATDRGWRDALTWRPAHENAAERLARYRDEYEAGPI